MPHAINPKTGKQLRGFAGMDPEKRRAISALGGASQAPHKRSFSRDRSLAVSAGRKGGSATRRQDAEAAAAMKGQD